MNETRKALNLIGLAQRAGKAVSGGFSVEKAVKEGRAVLLIIAEDASDNTKKRFYNMGTFYQVPVIEFSCKDGLGSCIGRAERSSLALTDAGLAEAVLKALDAYNTRR